MHDINTNSVIIKIENLNYFSGKYQILKNVNFEVKKGEILGLLGPNGSGKSTLLSIIASILKPSSGIVTIDKNLKIGFVPQEIALYTMLSAYENLKFWSSIYKIKQKESRILDILDFLKLSNFKNTQVHKFSIGMQRRLNIGIALIHDPDIIIMDEPTVGIDISSKLIILDEINKLKNLGKTFIYTTHNADEPEKIFDRVAVIRSGSIVSIGKIPDVLVEHNATSIEELMS